MSEENTIEEVCLELLDLHKDTTIWFDITDWRVNVESTFKADTGFDVEIESNGHTETGFMPIKEGVAFIRWMRSKGNYGIEMEGHTTCEIDGELLEDDYTVAFYVSP